MYRFMNRVERIVAYASLLAACLGLVEKGIHYVSIVQRRYRKKTRGFGFHV